jgi:hypothetical protein
MAIKHWVTAALIGFIFSPLISFAQEGTVMPEKPKGKIEVRRGEIRYAHDTSESWHGRMLERTVRRLEPTGIGKPEKINEYIAKYKSMAVFDPRVICFNVEGKAEDDKVILKGIVSFPEHHDGLISILTAMNLQNIQDNIEVAPSKKLGKLTFAIANAASVPFYSHVTGLQEQVTEAIFGENIFLLTVDSSSRYYYAQSAGGYIGWIDKTLVIPMDQDSFHKWQKGNRAIFFKEYITESVTIPIAASLPFKGQKIVLPTGKTIAIPKGYYRIYSGNTQFGKQLIATAKQYLGTPYVWGGVTKRGIDCSGFVQSVYRVYGINLPRDADEQAINGVLVGFRGYTADLLPGDLLYFAGHNGRITHTAIYIGKNQYIQATEPHVIISSWDPKASNYHEKTAEGFVFAKRVVR